MTSNGQHTVDTVSTGEALDVVREQIAEATAAKKCHQCGCLHSTVEALAETEEAAGLLPTFEAARAVYKPKRYDCLGCAVCYPAIAANAFAEAFPVVGEGLDLCPTEEPEERAGWPPLPGDYHVVRYGAPVAVCTLNSAGLAKCLAALRPEGLAVVGTMHTENLGVERVIRNVLANPHIRFLVLCGEDTQRRIGHLPGQSLAALFAGGLNERGRIVGADGKRPVLKNVSAAEVDAFRRQVELVDLIGEEREDVLLDHIAECVSRDPGPVEGEASEVAVPVERVEEPERLVLDPTGFFVIYPDARRGRLVVEHYTKAGLLDAVVEGTTPAALYAAVIERGFISRLDHAAYLGCELARAEHALRTGEPYVQDRAAGDVPNSSPAETTPDASSPSSTACGCATPCGT